MALRVQGTRAGGVRSPSQTRGQVRLLGSALLGLIILMALSVGIVYGLSSYRLSHRFEVRDSMPSITSDSASSERGRRLTFAMPQCAEERAASVSIDG